MLKLRYCPFICFIVFVISGCSANSEQYAKDPLGDTPIDFSVDLTVLGSKEQMDPATMVQPSRFMLFADGSLHWGPDKGLGTAWFPPLRRTLTREQVAGVWLYARQLGLADPENARPQGNHKLMQKPSTDRVVFILDITGRGVRWGFLQNLSVHDASSSALNDFARKLANLAWADDLASDRALIAPRRYDFGPDPYAQYRYENKQK